MTPETPTELSAGIDHLLMKDPAQRIQTADEVVELLKAVEAMLPRGTVPVEPFSKYNRLNKPPPRGLRAWWDLRGTTIGLVLLFAIVGLLLAEAFKLSRLTVLGQRDHLPSYADEGGPQPRLILPSEGGPIWNVRFSPKQNVLAIGMDDGRIKLWDSDKKRLLKDFEAHKGPVGTLQFASSGFHFASASDDGRFKVWDTEKFELYMEKNNGSPIWVLALADGDKNRHRVAAGRN